MSYLKVPYFDSFLRYRIVNILEVGEKLTKLVYYCYHTQSDRETTTLNENIEHAISIN